MRSVAMRGWQAGDHVGIHNCVFRYQGVQRAGSFGWKAFTLDEIY